MARVIGIVVLMGIVAAACAAPAPSAKKKPPPPLLSNAQLPGSWDMTWGSTACAMTLTKDGGYQCLFNGVLFWGAWALNEKEGIFTIHETTNGTSWSLYNVKLDPMTLSGNVVHSTTKVVIKRPEMRKE